MIAPLALIGLISLPIIVAFYMLRLRRRDLPLTVCTINGHTATRRSPACCWKPCTA